MSRDKSSLPKVVKARLLEWVAAKRDLYSQPSFTKAQMQRLLNAEKDLEALVRHAQ